MNVVLTFLIIFVNRICFKKIDNTNIENLIMSTGRLLIYLKEKAKMKYYETSKFPKTVGSVGFFSIIAVCLVAIGAITWFAVSRYNKAQEKPEMSPSSQVSEPPTVTPLEEDESLGESSANTPLAEPQENEPTVEAEASADEVPYEDTQSAVSFSLPQGKQLKGYSDTELQYSATYGDMRLHTGVDILAALGSEVKSTASGKVKEIAEDSLWGKCVVVEHSNGITAKYCGFDTLAVSEGEEIAVGRVLGTVGTIPSECADDSHIHIEIKKDGKTVSPSEVK